MFQLINIWAVLAASIAAFAIGSLWYSPLLFGKQWLQYRNVDPKHVKNMSFPASSMFLEFLCTFITAFVLALLTFALPATIYTAVVFGLIIWVGFYVPVLLSGVLWENKPFGYFLLTVGLRFTTVLTMSLIVVLWR